MPRADEWASAAGASADCSVAGAQRHRGSREMARRRRAAARACAAETCNTLALARGERQVAVDAARAFHWSECVSWTSEERASRVAALRRLLCTVFSSTGGGPPFYIQGVHDVGALLLLEMGEARAAPVLSALVCRSGLMRGFFQHDSLDCPLALLALLPAAVGAADAALSRALFASRGELARETVQVVRPALAALSWVLTWFAHAAPTRAGAAAIFHCIIRSRFAPLMPVYVASALLASKRGRTVLGAALGVQPIEDEPALSSALLAAIARADEGELHAAVSRVPEGALATRKDGEALALAAEALARKFPPAALLKAAPRAARDALRERWPEIIFECTEADKSPVVTTARVTTAAALVAFIAWITVSSHLGPP